MNDRRERLAAARVYLVCDDRSDSLLEAALEGGVDIVQLRMKDRDDQEVLAAARRLRRVCAAHDALFVLNDRPDLAAVADADGVHLGQDDIGIDAARQIVGSARLIGLSTHTPEQIDGASAGDVDYIGVGPVYETPTKPGRPSVGLELVQYASRNAAVPFFAIGGIGPASVEAVAEAGANRIAVVRALTDAAEPKVVARELREALGRPRVGRP